MSKFKLIFLLTSVTSKSLVSKNLEIASNKRLNNYKYRRIRACVMMNNKSDARTLI